MRDDTTFSMSNIIFEFDETARLRSITAKTTAKQLKGQMLEVRKLLAG